KGASIKDIADHIEHICSITGNSDTVALGTDLDGGFGANQAPEEIDTIADLQKLARVLKKRGYNQEDIEKIFHKNWLSRLKSAWKN
ncbi:membrane dipeptidase, partial [Candidatus Bipolaricaulota bacterium]|nr:membrane dipeptidase [Candidatus Bipolaricaulota bacterium]